jgi:hypothetical protein
MRYVVLAGFSLGEDESGKHGLAACTGQICFQLFF